MKKLLIVLATLFAFVALGTIQAQNQCVANCTAQMQVFPDVPAGHWASDAVDRITDLGIIIGFPDGTFRGNETLTRYQAALMFDRLINLLNANLASMQTIDDADIEALRRGVQSLSGEVAGLAQRVSANEVAIASISVDYGPMHTNAARISDLELMVTELRNRPAQVVENRVVETVQVAAPAPQTVTQVVGVPDELVARINANTAAASRMDGLAARIEENSALIAELSALTGRFDVLTEQDAILAASIEDLQQQVARAQTQANAAMEQANLAIELFSGMPVDHDMQPMEDARIPVLNQRIVDNNRSISALNDLMALFNSDLLSLQSDVAALRNGAHMVQPMTPEIDFTPLEDSIASNRSQIQGIREFVILLRRNQVAFDSRLNALEDLIDDSISGVEGDLALLTNRVNDIESDLLTFSGSIAAQFQVIRINGANFDVDRIFGFGGFKRESLSGTSTFGDEKVKKPDFTDKPGSSTFSTTLKVNLGFARDSDGAVGDPRALNTFGSAVTLKLKRAYNLCGNAACDASKQFSGYVFTLGDALFYYDPIGADLLTFGFGQDVDVTFSDYVVNTNLKADLNGNGKLDNNVNTPGFVGRLGSPEFLDFLAPKLTVVYTSPDLVSGSNLGSYNYLLGIRGEMAPQLFDGFETSGGVSFATSTQHDRELGDENKDNVTTTVFGVDGKIAYSPFTLEFEWARASRDEAGNATDPDPATVFFATVGVEPFDISIIHVKSVEVTYRDIAGGWTFYDKLDGTNAKGAGYNGQATDGGRFADDQAGIRANADFSLFIFDVDAYFDQYYISEGQAAGKQLGTSAFGLDADINIFAAFAVTGFFHNATIQDKAGGTFVQVDDVKSGRPQGDSPNPTSLGNTVRDKNNYDTGFGIGIAHNGDSDNALIPNLDLGFEFARVHAGFDATRIRANAAYDLDVSFLHLTPYANFEQLTDPDTGVVDTTTIQVGTNIQTETFDILFKPQFEATVNYRNVSYSHDDSTKNYTAEQLQYSVGVALNEFLLPYSVLTARYGNFAGVNSGFNTGKIFAHADVNDISRITSGYEITWDYYDLEFAYGLYTSDNDASDKVDPVTSQAFRIKYKVTF